MIENKVDQLKSKYLDSLRVYGSKINDNENEDVENVKKELKEKKKVVSRILNNYKVSLQQHQEFKEEISAARDIALSIESEIDLICLSLNIQYPDELKKKRTEDTRQDQLSGNEEEEEEGEREGDTSDKENSLAQESFNTAAPSDEYFTPNIQVRKSGIDSNAVFTPAIKSNSKLPIRRQL